MTTGRWARSRVLAALTTAMIAVGCGGTGSPDTPDDGPTVDTLTALLEPPATVTELIGQSAGVETIAEPGYAFVTRDDASDTWAAAGGTLASGLTIASGGHELRMTPLGADVPASVPANGFAVYREVGPSTDTAIQVLGPGLARILYVATGPAAPAAFDTALQIPEGGALTLAEQGAVVDIDGERAFEVAAPWAFDRNGRRIPARFAVSGSTLTLQVDHAAVPDVAYPVVADPFIVQAALHVVGWLVEDMLEEGLQALTGDECASTNPFSACTASAPGTEPPPVPPEQSDPGGGLRVDDAGDGVTYDPQQTYDPQRTADPQPRPNAPPATSPPDTSPPPSPTAPTPPPTVPTTSAPAPKPSASNLAVVIYGGGHVGVAFDVGWQAGRDPVTCHFLIDGQEVFTAQCGTHASKQFYGIGPGNHSFAAYVTDRYGVASATLGPAVRKVT